MGIKKIIYNYSYGNYGMIDQMSRFYVTFTKNKISYVKEPLTKDGNRYNPKIEISYNPLTDCGMVSVVKENEYSLYFEQLCDLVSGLIGVKIPENHICDAVAASIVIYFDDNKKVKIDGVMDSDYNKIIEKIAYKYMPSDFVTFFKGEYDLQALFND